ncbi:MAG TPA: phosphodiester glycosidase family protein [Candidatus Limnocylindria bacterium]|nr:phosphodiester glycosidase family protein [Candidatus Limnocylindria bacterium]
MGRVIARIAGALLVASTLVLGQPATPAQAACTGSVGPGIPPPPGLPGGVPGFHAQWYGQSGYPTLCPGQRSTATVAYYNSGSRGWVSGKLGEVAYLGTWGPEPGQDAISPLGGDGTAGSLSTGWPRYNRIALQPAAYVGPGQVAWFQFTIQAPVTPGTYRLYLRPLIEGATWMEDFGVFWLVTVLNPDGTPPAPGPSVYSPTGYSNLSVPTTRGTFNVHLIKERLADVSLKTVTANTVDCTSDCPAKPLAQYVSDTGAYAAMNGTYFCPPDYAACAGKVNSYDYAFYSSTLRKWLNRPALIGQNSLAVFNGSAATWYRRSYVYGQSATAVAAPLTAAVTSYPMLLTNGAVVDFTAELSDAQLTKGFRGSFGVDGTYLYLAIVTGASVTDSAYVLQALGVRDALNVDGGGSSAMWIGGSYKVGPGRQLPNALVLTKP